MLSRSTLWIVKVYDATAKIPSGLLRGNMNQFGDFPLCMSSGGRYCLAYVDIKLAATDYSTLASAHTLLHSHHAFRSKLSDPGHRVPRFSSMHWAVCVPPSCTAEDVEEAMSAVADRLSDRTGLKPTVQVDSEMCQVIDDKPLPRSTVFVGSLFLGLLTIIAISTAYDYNRNPGVVTTKAEILLAFSLKKNCGKLFSVEVPADDVSSLHGIRFLNAMMLYLSHKSMALFFNPYSNRTFMAEMLGKPWTVIARAASLYTDPFIMMSGLLTSYSLGKKLIKSQSINVPSEICSRLMRLMPTLGGLILFCTFILPHMGSGPQWPLVVNHHAELCKQYWWRNMLFIHNYFGFKNMCLTHTHHVGIDTQLFMVSPFLIYMVYKWPKEGMMTLLGIGTLSTVLRYYTVYARQLNLYVYFGSSVEQMFNTADYSYILPTHRATVYVIGIAMGYILRQWGKNIRLKTSHLTLGWLVALALLYQSVIQPSHMGDRFYSYDKFDAAIYSAFSPISWCLFYCWIIFTSHTGNGGFVSDLASWRGWQITTRLSYTFYLTQFPVFFFNVGRNLYSEAYSIQLLFDIKETIAVVLASMVLTLVIEMPFQNLRSMMLKKTPPPIAGVKPETKIAEKVQ
ncbi:NRF [Nesidiocoris tenuis]|uniref:NRF n=1 Tax=Nesidiocoris tenuis TaxID=355587 RepID=A0ABN7AZA6_9HEMI|nr:NRF [Nesidiocoris tenuis]